MNKPKRPEDFALLSEGDFNDYLISLDKAFRVEQGISEKLRPTDSNFMIQKIHGLFYESTADAADIFKWAKDLSALQGLIQANLEAFMKRFIWSPNANKNIESPTLIAPDKQEWEKVMERTIGPWPYANPADTAQGGYIEYEAPEKDEIIRIIWTDGEIGAAESFNSYTSVEQSLSSVEEDMKSVEWEGTSRFWEYPDGGNVFLHLLTKDIIIDLNREENKYSFGTSPVKILENIFKNLGL